MNSRNPNNTDKGQRRKLARAWAKLLVAGFGLSCCIPTSAQTVDGFNPTAAGGNSYGVHTMAVQADGKVLVGGWFTTLGGQTRNRIARLNIDGTLDERFNPDANGDVFLLATQEDGKILIGGIFTEVGGVYKNSMARLNADGSVDAAFDPGASGVSYPNVFSLVVQPDGKILVGGAFTRFAGYSRTNVARLNSDGTLDAAFDPGATHSAWYENPFVSSIALQEDGKILVGGKFTALCGQPREGIGRLNPDGSLDTGFNPHFAGYDTIVYSIAVQADGRILVGGEFMQGSSEPHFFSRINPDGTMDTSFDLRPGGVSDSVVNSVALQADGKILVGGAFTTLVGQARTNIARINADGTLDTAFANGAAQGGSSFVRTLTIQPDGKVLVGGFFSKLAGQSRQRLGRYLNTDLATEHLSYSGSNVAWLRSGSGPEVWRTKFQASTNGVDWFALGEGSRMPGGWEIVEQSLPTDCTLCGRGFVRSGPGNGSGWFFDVFAGGPAVLEQPQAQTNDATSTATLSVRAVGNQPLSYQWFHEGAPLVDDTHIGGATRAVLTVRGALGDDSGGYSVVISNQFRSMTSAVARLTVNDPVIAVQPLGQNREPGGSVSFSVTPKGTAPFGYQWLKNGAVLPGATQSSLTLTSVQTNDVGSYAVTVSNTHSSVVSVPAILTVNLTTLDSGFNGSADSYVYSLAVQPTGQILVGGSFTTLGGQSKSYVGRLYGDGSLDGSFAAAPNGRVSSVALPMDGRILVAGSFTKIGGQTRNYLARLNGDSTLDTGFNLGADNAVLSLAIQADQKVLVGGYFTTFAGQAPNYLARVNADSSFDATFCAETAWTSLMHVSSMVIQPDGWVVIGGAFGTWGSQPRSCIARLDPGGSLDSAFNPTVNSEIYALALQPDGKILAGGVFTNASGKVRDRIARFKPDGTLDDGFTIGADGPVYSLVLQTDGSVILGGSFTTVGGAPRTNLARINLDGALDVTFSPVANRTVYALALEDDGRILVGGDYSRLLGQTRNRLARLNNTHLASQDMTYDGSTLYWRRTGTCPEVLFTTLEVTTDNGLSWRYLGSGSRVSGGWRFSGLDVPTTATFRARGMVVGGFCNGSCWFVETVAVPIIIPKPLQILTGDGCLGVISNALQFSIAGSDSSVVVVEGSTNLQDWWPLQTNMLGTGPLRFRDPRATNGPAGFYRARLAP